MWRGRGDNLRFKKKKLNVDNKNIRVPEIYHIHNLLKSTIVVILCAINIEIGYVGEKICNVTS